MNRLDTDAINRNSPYDVYCADGEERAFLYLFKNGRFYIESEFDEPGLVTREMKPMIVATKVSW